MTFLSVCILWPAGDSMGLNSGFIRVPRKNGFTSTISSTNGSQPSTVASTMRGSLKPM
ncbi:hypothetical protein D3C87_2054650 [compost metagenome]